MRHFEEAGGHHSMRMIPKEALPPKATPKPELHGSDSAAVPQPSKQTDWVSRPTQ